MRARASVRHAQRARRLRPSGSKLIEINLPSNRCLEFMQGMKPEMRMKRWKRKESWVL